MHKIVQLEDLPEEPAEIEDLREPWKVKHKLADIIAICLFATPARCDDLKDVYYPSLPLKILNQAPKERKKRKFLKP